MGHVLWTRMYSSLSFRFSPTEAYSLLVCCSLTCTICHLHALQFIVGLLPFIQVLLVNGVVDVVMSRKLSHKFIISRNSSILHNIMFVELVMAYMHVGKISTVTVISILYHSFNFLVTATKWVVKHKLILQDYVELYTLYNHYSIWHVSHNCVTCRLYTVLVNISVNDFNGH